MSVPIPYEHSSYTDGDTCDLKQKAAKEMFARLVGTHAWRSQQLETRRREVSTLLDRLVGCQFDDRIWSPTPDARGVLERLFASPIAKVVLTGHSFGGCTAMYAAATDDRVHECVALDPWMFPLPSGDIGGWYCRLSPLRVLAISSYMFQWAENVFAMRQYLSHVDGEARAEVLLASTHHDFTDFACLIKPWIMEWARSPVSQIAPEVAILASVAATTKFLGNSPVPRADEHDWAWKRALSGQDLQVQPLRQ